MSVKRLIPSVLLLLFVLAGYSQNTDNNAKMIEDLTRRLNDLKVAVTDTISADTLRKHITQLQDIVRAKQEEIREFRAGQGADCYLILASFRKKSTAERWISEHAGESCSVMSNRLNTWHHIVSPMQMVCTKAGSEVSKKRAAGFPDAWWLKKDDLK